MPCIDRLRLRIYRQRGRKHLAATDGPILKPSFGTLQCTTAHSLTSPQPPEIQAHAESLPLRPCQARGRCADAHNARHRTLLLIAPPLLISPIPYVTPTPQRHRPGQQPLQWARRAGHQPGLITQLLRTFIRG